MQKEPWKRVRRSILVTLLVVGATSLLSKWFAAVLIRKLFIQLDELDGGAGKGLQPTDDPFWRAVFMDRYSIEFVVALAVGNALVSAIFSRTKDLLADKFAVMRNDALRSQIVARSMYGSGNHVDPASSTEATFMLQKLESIKTFEANVLFERLQGVFLTLIFLPVGFVFDPVTTLVALLVYAALVFIPPLVIAQLIGESELALAEIVHGCFRVAADIVRTSDIISVSNSESFELAKLRAMHSSSTPFHLRRRKWVFVVRFLPSFTIFAFVAGLVMVNYALISNMSYDDGVNQVFSLLVIILLISEVNEQVTKISSSDQEAERYKKDLSDVERWIGKSTPPNHAPINPSLQPSLRGDIVASNVVVAFHNANDVAGEIIKFPQEIRFAHGRSTAVVGESGSGKSTLLKVLAGLVQPSKGTVRFGQVALDSSSLRTIRSTMAMVSQDSLLFARSVWENVWYGNEGDPDRVKIEQALDDVGLLTWVQGLPDGLDTVFELNEQQVSGGQAQRLQMARLLCKGDREIVLLDEPLSALDGANRERILRKLEQFLSSKTCVWVTHNDNVRDKICDNVVDLEVLAKNRHLEAPESLQLIID